MKGVRIIGTMRAIHHTHSSNYSHYSHISHLIKPVYA